MTSVFLKSGYIFLLPVLMGRIPYYLNIADMNTSIALYVISGIETLLTDESLWGQKEK